MTKKTISKILQVVVILTFTLPFFYTGCGLDKDKDKAKEKAIKDSLLADSIAKAKTYSAIVDSTTKATNTFSTNQEKLIAKNPDTTSTKVNSSSPPDNSANSNNYKKEKEQPTDKIVEDYPFLSIILKPAKDTYSGLGIIVNEISFMVFFSLCFSLLLLIIGLLIKFLEPHALKSTVIIDILILLGVWISRSPSWNSDRLWGFWVCLSVTGLLLIYDTYIMITNKR